MWFDREILVVSGCLDWMVLEVLSNLGDSMILCMIISDIYYKVILQIFLYKSEMVEWACADCLPFSELKKPLLILRIKTN